MNKAHYYTKTKYNNPYIYVGLLGKPSINAIIKTHPTTDLIKKLLPTYYGVTFKDINVKTRKRPISDIKHHFIALVREYTDLSLNSIGALFTYKKGGIHYSSVINSLKAWENICYTDKTSNELHKKFKSEIISYVQQNKV